ncbi:hypothetical protein PLESTB_000743100 [Pleodorina starrii]|uniref:mRNA-decapping enzyme-like protein n=1 Tax=Pleodorina starrii TaxID=330485 RepID=A0A9W6BL61_9CHLO|nr:hypothetical protein PLESTM_000181600 [Pleodorina starrii]GLC53421.1 hypothetical protein PLESTB_000743100 [Pleodorina starrii]
MLGVLKGFDPDVEEVLASSGHVSLYTMAVESQQWTRKDVEGSLFLLKRRGTPRFRMMVLNKLSTENYIEDIHSGLDFELNPPYLMYTHGNSEIIGVWFYEQDDLYRVENVLMRVKQTGYGPKKPTVTSQAPTSARGNKGDDDNFYDKPNAGGAAASSQQQQRHQQQPMAQSTAAPVASVEGANTLATLLRNATLKQQQAAEQATPASSSQPQPLPPSFFSQPQRVAQPTAPQAQAQPFPPSAAPPQAQVPAAAASQAAPAAHLQPRVPQMLPPSAAAADQQQQPTGGQMGGPLAKLFANAHKPPTAQPQAQAASPQPAPSAPQQQQQLLPGPGVAGGVSDEERVRRLLARIATNDALVKLLAVEMRAVGLL